MEYRLGCFGVLNQEGMADTPLKLLDGGIERRDRERYFFDNKKREGYGGYLFQYTLAGDGCLERGGTLYRLPAGKGFLLPIPDDSKYYLPEGASWELLYLHFEGPAAAPFAARLEEYCGSVFFLHPDSSAVRSAVMLQKRMLQGERLLRYEGGEFLYRFLCSLLRELESPSFDGRESLASLAADMMEKEAGSLEGIEELAARLGVSPAHLARSFHRQLGASPIQYLTGIRLQKAVNELLNTEDSVKQIALRAGFSGGNYFCKVFRKNMGMSPGEYRRSRRGEQPGNRE